MAGMGVIMMLGIYYFVSLSRVRPSAGPSGLDCQTHLGPILVFFSILFNLVQTILDMVRGWDVSVLLMVYHQSPRSFD